jgi:hypothetical protein
MSNSVQPTPPAPLETKGSMARSMAQALAEHRLLDSVAAAVSPAARAMLLDPPLPTVWIDGRILNQVYEAILELHGADVLRRLNRQAVERGVSPLIRGAAESVLRVFGVSPATLLSRLGRVGGTIARGVTYRYDVDTETSGVFEIEYPMLVDVPVAASIATVGGLDLVFDMCSVRGSFGPPEVVENGRNNRVRFPVSWRAGRGR